MCHKFIEEFKSCNKHTTQSEALWLKHNSKQCSLEFILTRSAFRFQCMVYETGIYLNKVKLWNKRHFLENKTHIMQHVFKRSKFLCFLSIQNKFPGVFSYMCLCMPRQALERLKCHATVLQHWSWMQSLSCYIIF